MNRHLSWRGSLSQTSSIKGELQNPLRPWQYLRPYKPWPLLPFATFFTQFLQPSFRILANTCHRYSAVFFSNETINICLGHWNGVCQLLGNTQLLCISSCIPVYCNFILPFISGFTKYFPPPSGISVFFQKCHIIVFECDGVMLVMSAHFRHVHHVRHVAQLLFAGRSFPFASSICQL